VTVPIPRQLRERCEGDPRTRTWLEALPSRVREVAARWGLALEAPFDGHEVSCSWVAPATRSDGSAAILKVAFPHPEADQEADGLIFWDGDPTVRLLAHDRGANAMLLERCTPGMPLRTRPEAEQDPIIAAMLRRLWRVAPPSYHFRPLAAMAELWISEAEAEEEHWEDPGLVRAGLALWRELCVASDDDVLLATDLHAGNVLRAERQEWLVIDPKPFLGDRTYDATQHFFNCGRRHADPLALIRRLSELLDLDPERLRLWCFARCSAQWPQLARRSEYSLARALAP
jgi:streptomycin 6-kinase